MSNSSNRIPNCVNNWRKRNPICNRMNRITDGLTHSYTGDQYRQDMFFRYNQTFQYFFDQSARVETEFGD